MTKYTSDKIRNISFIAIIAVFFIHTDYAGGRDSGSFFFQELLHTCANCAVPFFFIISGYLFFYQKEDMTLIKKGIKKRVRTLLIPYIVWCTLFVVQLWLASMATPLNQDYFSILYSGEIMDALRFLKRMYIAPPLAFHLWYVRDLMAVVAISPLIFLWQRKHPLIFLLIIAVVCGFLKLIPWLSWPLTWFSLGSYFAFSKKDILELNNKWIGVVMLLGYVVITGWLIYNGAHTTADKWYSFPVILLGIVGVWNTYDIIGIHKYFTSYLTDQTFFLYCAHVPFLTIISTLLFPVVTGNSFMEGMAYIVPAVVTCMVLVTIAQIWKRVNTRSRISHNIYKYITGGR